MQYSVIKFIHASTRWYLFIERAGTEEGKETEKEKEEQG